MMEPNPALRCIFLGSNVKTVVCEIYENEGALDHNKPLKTCSF